MKRKYVVLYGMDGVSKEFRTLNSAERYAKSKANSNRRLKVSIDHLDIYSRNNWSQGHHKHVRPEVRSKIKPKRRISRNNDVFSTRGLNFRF